MTSESTGNPRSYVVAGGTKGIGLSLVSRLIGGGHHVDVISRSPLSFDEQPESLVEAVQAGRLRHHVHDFATPGPMELPLPDKLDGVVYCPGTINLRSFRALKIEDFRRDLDVNLLGAVALLQSCLTALKRDAEACSRSVVLVSTVAVQTGMTMHASVAAAKGAVEGLTRSLAAEWAPQIRVNAVAPALTQTPLAGRLLSTPERVAAMGAKYPLQRIGQPDDIAETIQFLLDDRSQWMTGQILGVDGGMSSLLA